jgi:hypothetical protein
VVRLVSEALRTLDETIDAAVKSLFDEQNFEDSMDQVCLQMIFDLKLCDQIIKKLSDVKSKQFDSTKLLVSIRAKISRIRGQISAKIDLNEKTLESNLVNFIAKNAYLLVLFVPENIGSNERVNNPSKMNMNNSTIFASSSTNRLQLLPLPLKSVRSNFAR